MKSSLLSKVYQKLPKYIQTGILPLLMVAVSGASQVARATQENPQLDSLRVNPHHLGTIAIYSFNTDLVDTLTAVEWVYGNINTLWLTKERSEKNIIVKGVSPQNNKKEIRHAAIISQASTAGGVLYELFGEDKKGNIKNYYPIAQATLQNLANQGVKVDTSDIRINSQNFDIIYKREKDNLKPGVLDKDGIFLLMDNTSVIIPPEFSFDYYFRNFLEDKVNEDSENDSLKTLVNSLKDRITTTENYEINNPIPLGFNVGAGNLFSAGVEYGLSNKLRIGAEYVFGSSSEDPTIIKSELETSGPYSTQTVLETSRNKDYKGINANIILTQNSQEKISLRFGLGCGIIKRSKLEEITTSVPIFLNGEEVSRDTDISSKASEQYFGNVQIIPIGVEYNRLTVDLIVRISNGISADPGFGVNLGYQIK